MLRSLVGSEMCIRDRHKRVTEKTVLANRTIRTIYTLIWYALYDLRPGKNVGPILTTLRPNEATSFTISHKNFLFIAAPLPSARQHPSYGDCLEVKREYYQNCSVLDCVTQNVHSQQHTYASSSYRSNRFGLSHWDPYAVRRGGCLELYYCNMVGVVLV